MSELDDLISAAFKSEGKEEDVNKVYLALLRTMLFIPIQKKTSESASETEPFVPLFAKVQDHYFMVVFDSLERLTLWAGEQFNQMDYVELSGRDVIAGINEQVYLSLNVGTPFHKEFSPDEVKRLKMVVAKVDQILSK